MVCRLYTVLSRSNASSTVAMTDKEWRRLRCKTWMTSFRQFGLQEPTWAWIFSQRIWPSHYIETCKGLMWQQYMKRNKAALKGKCHRMVERHSYWDERLTRPSNIYYLLITRNRGYCFLGKSTSDKQTEVLVELWCTTEFLLSSLHFLRRLPPFACSILGSPNPQQQSMNMSVGFLYYLIIKQGWQGWR
jgi:hypothetical protein